MFRKTLRDHLEKKFGRHKITAKELAAAFNLIAETPITEETARKWINGLALPRFERLYFLIHWLDIDPNLIFNYHKSDKESVNLKLLETTENVDNVSLDTIKKIIQS